MPGCDPEHVSGQTNMSRIPCHGKSCGPFPEPPASKSSVPLLCREGYRISYLSTRKAVSVENLTGLFPSTWVTLVTCKEKGTW